MTPERLFSLCNSFALIGWVILVFAGRMRWAARLVTGVVIPLIVAILYTYLIAAHWGETQGGFSTLDGVAALFSNRWLLLAGWIHYLAFDLFIGSWEVRDSQSLGISHFIVIPCLALTFMFGPAGLLLYFIVRTVRTRVLEIKPCG
jgi:ABA4-like protein